MNGWLDTMGDDNMVMICGQLFGRSSVGEM